MKPEDRLLDALALAEGEADDLTRARVEADPALRAEAEALGGLVDRLRSAEPALPPPELRGSILAALEAEAGPAPAPTVSWFWRLTRLGLVGAAAAVLIGVGIGGGGLGVTLEPPPARVEPLRLAAWEGPGMAPSALGPGDLVKIPAGAKATLDWRGRGPLELHGGTVAVLEEHAIQLVSGTVISGIDPDDSVGFRVRTDDAVVSVVGTRFRVTFEAERGTEVEVFEGEVRVEDLRSRLVRILTPALRAIWQAWNVDGDTGERPDSRPNLTRKPPPATRPATGPDLPEVPPTVRPPPPTLEPPAVDPAEESVAPEATESEESDETEDADVASKSGDEPEEDEPEDPSYVPADTVEQGFWPAAPPSLARSGATLAASPSTPPRRGDSQEVPVARLSLDRPPTPPAPRLGRGVRPGGRQALPNPGEPEARPPASLPGAQARLRGSLDDHPRRPAPEPLELHYDRGGCARRAAHRRSYRVRPGGGAPRDPPDLSHREHDLEGADRIRPRGRGHDPAHGGGLPGHGLPGLPRHTRWLRGDPQGLPHPGSPLAPAHPRGLHPSGKGILRPWPRQPRRHVSLRALPEVHPGDLARDARAVCGDFLGRRMAPTPRRDERLLLSHREVPRRAPPRDPSQDGPPGSTT